jgi:hypothetical protein
MLSVKGRGPRLSCQFVAVGEVDGRRFGAVVKNIGANGFGLETDQLLKKGQDLVVEGLPCRVKWTRRLPNQQRRVAGLQLLAEPAFLAESWMANIIRTLVDLENQQASGSELVAEPPCPEPGIEGEKPAVVVEEPDVPEVEDVVAQVEEVVAAAERLLPPMARPSVLAEASPAEESLDGFGELLRESQLLSVSPSSFLSRAMRELRAFAFQDKASVVERRRVGRLSGGDVHLTCQVGKDTLPGWLLDLSPTGAGLRSVRALARGGRVTLEAAGGSAVDGTVRYCRRAGANFRVGVALSGTPLDGTWVYELLRELGFARRHLAQQGRQFVRVAAALPVEVRSWKGDFVLSQFDDLSRGGAQLRSSSGWAPGENLRLVLGPIGTLPVIYFTATVLHQRQVDDGWLMRLRFDDLDAGQIGKLDKYIVALLEARSG